MRSILNNQPLIWKWCQGYLYCLFMFTVQTHENLRLNVRADDKYVTYCTEANRSRGDSRYPVEGEGVSCQIVFLGLSQGFLINCWIGICWVMPSWTTLSKCLYICVFNLSWQLASYLLISKFTLYGYLTIMVARDIGYSFRSTFSVQESITRPTCQGNCWDLSWLHVFPYYKRSKA